LVRRAINCRRCRIEAREAAAIAQINEALSSNPDFQRCTSDGTPDPNGTHWKLREPVSV